MCVYVEVEVWMCGRRRGIKGRETIQYQVESSGAIRCPFGLFCSFFFFFFFLLWAFRGIFIIGHDSCQVWRHANHDIFHCKGVIWTGTFYTKNARYHSFDVSFGFSGKLRGDSPRLHQRELLSAFYKLDYNNIR